MIVKVQLPQFSTEPDPPAYIYSRDRKVELFVPLANVEEAMRGRAKVFFEAVVLSDGTIQLGREVADPGW